MMHFCCCLCGHVLAARLVLEQSTVVTWWGSAKQQCAGGEVWHSNRDTETFTCVEDPEVITLSFARVAPWSYAAGAAEKRSSAASLALGPTASVGFSPDNPQSPEAEQVPFHPSICLEKHLSCSRQKTHAQQPLIQQALWIADFNQMILLVTPTLICLGIFTYNVPI